MIDLIKTAERIELCYADDDYYIRITSMFANVTFVLGDALTAARVMQANKVRFFDYNPDLANDCELFGAFVTAADHIGYAI